MDGVDIEAEARRYVSERDLVLWEEFPWDGAMVWWPADGELRSFFMVMERMQASILYMEGAGEIIGFALNGVIHAFPSAEMRRRALVSDALISNGEIAVASEPTVDGEEDAEPSSPESPYYDYRTRSIVDGDLRKLIDRIVADDRFDGFRSRHLMAEHTAHLDGQDAETVCDVANRIFGQTVGKELDNRAMKRVPRLAAHPDFDPLAWGGSLREFLANRLPDEDPRVLERLERELPGYAREVGLVGHAEKEIAQKARSLLEALPALTRDELGFASKNTKRLQLLDPYLGDCREIQRPHVLRHVVALEYEMYSDAREARYATASRRLLDSQWAKAEISRRLGISTSVIDRIVAAHRVDVDLEPGDPILTTLAPEVAGNAR